MRIKVMHFLGAVIFVLVGLILFGVLQVSFTEKNSYAKYRAFLDEEKIDILILGNSHANAGISASQIEEEVCRETGEDISVFNYAIYGMRIEQIYFFVKELLKHQTPDLIILETYTFCPIADEHREILARRAFDVMPLNRNKIEAIRYSVREDHWSYYIPFIKYHTRWKELSHDDIAMLYDRSLWDGAGDGGNNIREVCEDANDGWFQQDTGQIEDSREINDTEKECLDKLLVLLKEKNIKLMLVSVPYKVQMDMDSVEMIKINNYLRENYVNQNENIQLLDMNRLWKEMDFNYNDLVNEGHVNKSGMEKIMAQLVPYLQENYDFLTAK